MTLDNCTDGSVQLVDGNNDYSGRVEVCNNGVWGTVCNDKFELVDAHVLCNQLGIFEKGKPVLLYTIIW